MKKAASALVLVLAVLAASGRVLAQSSIVGQIAGPQAASDKLNFGLKFGLSCSQLRGLGYGDRLGGFHFGILANIRLSEKLSLSPELTLFSRKGATEIPFITTGDPSLDPYFADPTRSALVLDYIEIPVRVMYRLGRFALGGGPFAGFLQSASERFRAETGTGEELLHSRDVTYLYKKADLGLVFEAAWTVAKPRRGMGLIVHFRYQAGFIDVRGNTVLVDPAAYPRGRNSVIQIYLSFPFVH